MKRILRFSILSNEKKGFLRELEMYDMHTLLDLHKAIQTACDYDQTHLASFFMVDNKWVKQKEFTLMPMDAHTGLYTTEYMGNIKLHDLFSKTGKKMLYLFDLFSERGFMIILREIYPARKDDLIPRLLHSEGVPPRQIKMGENYIDNLLDAFSNN